MGAISLALSLVGLIKTLAGMAWFLMRLMWRVLGVLTRITQALILIIIRSRGGRVHEETSVHIRRDWNDHRIGMVRWSELRDPRWDNVSGGEQNHTPKPFIHGYVWCDKVNGDIAHSCIHGPPPHNIKVCLVKNDNTKAVWNRLLERAGPKPRRKWLIGPYRP